VLGVYGALSYMVVAGRRDMALRIACGADPGRIVRGVVARGGRLALAGIGIGAVAAALSLRIVRALLFGVGTLEPGAWAGAALLLLLATAAAAAGPARRAAAVDAAAALREE
jgi:ABC-type antimicrobial peptide transport system permease subunit